MPLRSASPVPLPPRPASPVEAQSGRTARAAAPPAAAAGRGLPPGAFAPNDAETTDVQPVDEDDRVIVPAAPLSALGPKPHYRPAAPGVPVFRTLAFRRTAIPILLTCGGLMLAVAVLKFVVDPDSVLALLPAWTPIALAGVAVVVVSVAVLNMAQVRQQLAAERSARMRAGTSAAAGRGPAGR
jgi:hypothetical protein